MCGEQKPAVGDVAVWPVLVRAGNRELRFRLVLTQYCVGECGCSEIRAGITKGGRHEDSFERSAW